MTAFDHHWESAFELLGEVLESRGASSFRLVVGGGAALRATAVISRVTRDVDVIALRGEVDGEVRSAWPFPSALREAVADVAEELGLPSGWLNSSAALLVGPLEELPPEVWLDLVERCYGSCLRVGFIGRRGQIPLKLHAAVGRREARDLEDLRALQPGAEECRQAVAWVSRNGLDAVGEQRLREVLHFLGHESD